MVRIRDASDETAATKSTTTTNGGKISTTTNGTTTTTRRSNNNNGKGGGSVVQNNKNVVSFYGGNIENMKKLCDFLRSQQGPPVREALLMDKRVHYLKGEKLVNFLYEPRRGTKWPKSLLKFNDRHEAVTICKELCKLQFIIKTEKRNKGELQLPSRSGGGAQRIDFDETSYYTWIYEGDKTWSYVMTAGLIFGCIFCVCFPIWPVFLRIFVWYMSVSFLLFIFSSVAIRAFIFLCIWIIGYEFWILPNMFDETLGFVDSFKPLYSFEPTKPGQLPYRVGVAVGFFGFCWWAVTQPSEFDGFIQSQHDFLSDLYNGTLLSDVSQHDKDNIDKPKVKSLDDLLRSLDVEDDEDIDDVDGIQMNNIKYENENENNRDDQNNNIRNANIKLSEVDEDAQLDSLLDNLVNLEEEEDENEDEE